VIGTEAEEWNDNGLGYSDFAKGPPFSAAATSITQLTNRMRACSHARMVAVTSKTTRVTKGKPRSGGAVLEKEPLQVRIPVSVKRRFKSYAALRGIEPNTLFVEIWEHYESSYKADHE
jgi:hypothetical protein